MVESNLKPVRVSIRNYQSIDALDLEVRGFTCVTGKTNIGKSAILRAISSAILNESVNGMIRSGSKFASVELQSEAWGFKWEKGPGVSRYHVAGTTYDKVGQATFEAVTNMGFGSVKLGQKEVYPWWASQFEPIFLLGATGAAVTDFVSDISRLTVLQDAITLSSRGKKKATDEAKRSAEQAVELRAKAAVVAAVDHLAQAEKELVEQEASIQDYRRRIASAESVQERIRLAEEGARILSANAQIKLPVDRVQDDIEKVRRAMSFWSRLRECARAIIAMRDIAKVQIPEDVPDLDALRRAAKHSGVPALRSAVEAISAAAGAKVPDAPPVEEIESLVRASSHLKRLDRCVAAIRGLPKPPQVPEGDVDSSDIEKLRRASDAARRILSAKSDSSKLQKESEDLAASIAEVDRQISLIPSCPSCGRVVSGPDGPKHQHKEVSHA